MLRLLLVQRLRLLYLQHLLRRGVLPCVLPRLLGLDVRESLAKASGKCLLVAFL